MERKTFWLIVGIAIGILVLLVIWQTVQISSIASSATPAVQSAGQQATSYGGMVGGC